jgi:hypothetical protein
MGMSDLQKWLKSGKHLPDFMRDFHDQKDLFKSMHFFYRDMEPIQDAPNWVDGHTYVIDYFLWYMASRGYTLQKCRKQLKFKPFVNIKDYETTLLKD